MCLRETLFHIYTRIKKWYDEGKYKPYSDDNPRELIDVIKYAMSICPLWMRFPRVIRDIPLTLIEGGNKYSNLRQMIEDELKNNGFKFKEMRSREIGRNLIYLKKSKYYKVRRYNANNSIEYFISLESYDNVALFGFLRLRIPPKNHNPVHKILKRLGGIRELHVYNNLVPVGSSKKMATQHRGVGKNLIRIAELISFCHNLDGTAVITGEGVRDYYHKRGYKSIQTYAVKKFYINLKSMITILIPLFISILLIILIHH